MIYTLTDRASTLNYVQLAANYSSNYLIKESSNDGKFKKALL